MEALLVRELRTIEKPDGTKLHITAEKWVWNLYEGLLAIVDVSFITDKVQEWAQCKNGKFEDNFTDAVSWMHRAAFKD